VKAGGDPAGTWGLTAETFGKLQRELSDHVACLSEQPAAAKALATEVERKLAQPRTRRRLTAPYLGDQVYATLNRRPTREEWRELLWLLLWYIGIMVSDGLAMMFQQSSYTVPFRDPLHLIPVIIKLMPLLPDNTLHAQLVVTMAWALRAICLGGFFGGLALSLVRAWRSGAGVFIARLLQFKLLHTLLVVGMLLILGEGLWHSSFQPMAQRVELPVAINALTIAIVLLLLALIVLFASRRRAWGLSLGIALTAIFLYSGGPVVMQITDVGTSLGSRTVDYEGRKYKVPSDDPADIARAVARNRQWAKRQLGPSNYGRMDILNNRFYRRHDRVARGWGTLLGNVHEAELEDRRTAQAYLAQWMPPGMSWPTYELRRGHYVAAPVAAPGGGLGWLAAPIPALGLAGLVGLLLVMGRRSVIDGGIYLTLCLAALATTVLPFSYSGQAVGAMVAFNAVGMVAGPLPGFESLLVGSDMSDVGVIIFGLILSAGAPWLLAALVLKPRAHEPEASDEAGPQLAQG
jgi:hypothetical protein